MGFFTAATFKEHLSQYYLHMRSAPERDLRTEGKVNGAGARRFKFYCECWQKTYKTAETLATHRQDFHQASPWRCDPCGVDLETRSKFKKHVSETAGHMQITLPLSIILATPIQQPPATAIASSSRSVSSANATAGPSRQRAIDTRPSKVSMCVSIMCAI
jgi:hypothetical protein